MLPSPVVDIKAFVPSKDQNISKAFYTNLGFTVNWSNDEISELQMGSFRFLLQKFYVPQAFVTTRLDLEDLKGNGLQALF